MARGIRMTMLQRPIRVARLSRWRMAAVAHQTSHNSRADARNDCISTDVIACARYFLVSCCGLKALGFLPPNCCPPYAEAFTRWITLSVSRRPNFVAEQAMKHMGLDVRNFHDAQLFMIGT